MPPGSIAASTTSCGAHALLKQQRAAPSPTPMVQRPPAEPVMPTTGRRSVPCCGAPCRTSPDSTRRRARPTRRSGRAYALRQRHGQPACRSRGSRDGAGGPGVRKRGGRFARRRRSRHQAPRSGFPLPSQVCSQTPGWWADTTSPPSATFTRPSGHRHQCHRPRPARNERLEVDCVRAALRSWGGRRSRPRLRQPGPRPATCRPSA